MDRDRSFPERLRLAISEIRADLGAAWPPVDDSGVPRGPVAHLVDAFAPMVLGSAEHHRLAWLTLHACRRSLVHWELSSDGTEPHEALHVVRTWLGQHKQPSNWDALCTPCQPHSSDPEGPRQDARWVGLAVAHLALFARRAQAADAFQAITYADMSFELSSSEAREQFRAWLIDIGIPAALSQRDLNPSEAKAVRTLDSGTMRRHSGRS